MLELIPSLLGSARFVVAREAGCGEGVDRIQVPKARAVTVDDTTIVARGLDILPNALVSRVRRYGNRRPVHDFVEPLDLEALLDILRDLLVGVVTPANLKGGRWCRRPKGRKDLERTTVSLRGLPKLDIVDAAHIGKLMRALRRPGVAQRNDQGGLPFGRQ